MELQSDQWQQAELSSTDNNFENVLGTIVAFDRNGKATLIGTAFLVDIYEGKAVALTAAHNFSAIRKAQSPHQKHHATALPEFLGNLEKVDLDESKVSVICSQNGVVDVTKVTLAGWDKSQDIGFMVLEAQNHNNFFASTISLKANPPRVGDEVALLGYSNMSIEEQSVGCNGLESLKMKQRLLLRKGRVTAEYPEGHSLCRGPCIETSIPIFPGMSGGPALLVRKAGEPVCAFGLISSDSSIGDAQRNSTLHQGDAVVALFHAETKVTSNGKKVVSIQLNSPFYSKNHSS